MVTSKKRQEFQMQLLKRARRRAQKKIEYLEDDRNWKEREIGNLRRLCTDRGCNEEEIALCKPRRRTIYQKMDTSMGLSSIASLSLGLSMSMTGAGRAVMCRSLGTASGSAGQQPSRALSQPSPPAPSSVKVTEPEQPPAETPYGEPNESDSRPNDRQRSLQQPFPLPVSSFGPQRFGIMQQMSAAAQNRLGLNLPLNPAAILATSGGAQSLAPHRRHTASAGGRQSPTTSGAAIECKSSSVDHGLMKIAAVSSSVQRQGFVGSRDPDSRQDGVVTSLNANVKHEVNRLENTKSAENPTHEFNRNGCSSTSLSTSPNTNLRRGDEQHHLNVPDVVVDAAESCSSVDGSRTSTNDSSNMRQRPQETIDMRRQTAFADGGVNPDHASFYGPSDGGSSGGVIVDDSFYRHHRLNFWYNRFTSGRSFDCVHLSENWHPSSTMKQSISFPVRMTVGKFTSLGDSDRGSAGTSSVGDEEYEPKSHASSDASVGIELASREVGVTSSCESKFQTDRVAQNAGMRTAASGEHVTQTSDAVTNASSVALNAEKSSVMHNNRPVYVASNDALSSTTRFHDNTAPAVCLRSSPVDLWIENEEVLSERNGRRRRNVADENSLENLDESELTVEVSSRCRDAQLPTQSCDNRPSNDQSLTRRDAFSPPASVTAVDCNKRRHAAAMMDDPGSGRSSSGRGKRRRVDNLPVTLPRLVGKGDRQLTRYSMSASSLDDIARPVSHRSAITPGVSGYRNINDVQLTLACPRTTNAKRRSDSGAVAAGEVESIVSTGSSGDLTEKQVSASKNVCYKNKVTTSPGGTTSASSSCNFIFLEKMAAAGSMFGQSAKREAGGVRVVLVKPGFKSPINAASTSASSMPALSSQCLQGARRAWSKSQELHSGSGCSSLLQSPPSSVVKGPVVMSNPVTSSGRRRNSVHAVFVEATGAHTKI